MSELEHLIAKTIEYIDDNSINTNKTVQATLSNWLGALYADPDFISDGFDKIIEIEKLFNFVEVRKDSLVSIKDSSAAFEARREGAICVLYTIALADYRKLKLDILKIKEDLGIEEMYKKYES